MDISLEKNEIDTIISGLEALNRTGVTMQQSSTLIQLANKLSGAMMNQQPKITPMKPKDDGK